MFVLYVSSLSLCKVNANLKVEKSCDSTQQFLFIFSTQEYKVTFLPLDCVYKGVIIGCN